MLSDSDRQLLALKTKRTIATLTLLIPVALWTTVLVAKKYDLSGVEKGFFVLWGVQAEKIGNWSLGQTGVFRERGKQRGRELEVDHCN